MALTLQRAQEVGTCLKTLVVAANGITEEDLSELLAANSKELATGPLVDPTAWQSGGMFEANRQTTKVLRAILTFKQEVKGIGDFK